VTWRSHSWWQKCVCEHPSCKRCRGPAVWVLWLGDLGGWAGRVLCELRKMAQSCFLVVIAAQHWHKIRLESAGGQCKPAAVQGLRCNCSSSFQVVVSSGLLLQHCSPDSMPTIDRLCASVSMQQRVPPPRGGLMHLHVRIHMACCITKSRATGSKKLQCPCLQSFFWPAANNRMLSSTVQRPVLALVLLRLWCIGFGQG